MSISKEYLQEFYRKTGIVSESVERIGDDKTSIHFDEDVSYKEFAKDVADIILNDYGEHAINDFMKILHGELGI